MKTSTATSAWFLATIVLLCFAHSAGAEEWYVVRDGRLIDEGLDWPDGLSPERRFIPDDPFWGKWTHCAGTTRDGLFDVPRTFEGRNNHARFKAAKSALGDCEFKVVFSCPEGRGTAMPIVQIQDRGRLLFARDGSQIWMSLRKQALPLETFAAPCDKSPYDGNLHSMAVKRIDGNISFYYDDNLVNEQPIDPNTNLYIWFDALGVALKIKSIKLTAGPLSDELTTAFKSAAPVEKIFVGSGASAKPEYGKACRYRIPALTVSTRGTILAFAEARRTDGADIGNIDAVLRRSEDGGKTWGPEIVVWDDGDQSVNNPSAVVDPETGRTWVFMGRWVGTTPSQHVAYSDDDGKTWSKSQDMTQILRDRIEDGRRLVIPGPGAGIALQRGEHAGRLVIPMNHGAAWGPSVIFSDDHGKTWKPGGALHANIGESKCAELSDGSVLFVGNPGPPETRRRLTIIGEGGTQNATELWHADELNHVGCQGAVERYSWPEGDKPGVILYSGPGVTTARAHGTLYASHDEGKTWPWKQEYYEGGSGYSDVSVLPDGRVAVLFEKDGKSDLGFMILPAPPTEPPVKPLVFDEEIGHYRDLSYEALSDEGLSWEQRTRLFGGETIHYGELTDKERKSKEEELDQLLARIDATLVETCEADVREWLDKVAARPLKHEDWRQDWSVYTRSSMWQVINGAVALFRGYEIFGDEKYLQAGLSRADVFLREQTPRGNWRGNICRIQDKFQDGPFFVVMYAYKVSGDKKYLDSAKRCADCLLALQRSSGGWPDQWPFDGARLVNSGIVHGMSHNDSATTSMFQIMVIMYHLTGDEKYVANLHELGPFIAKTNLGEGEVVGWAGGYDDNGRPLRVRQYEIEVVQPAFLPRSVGPLLIWLYLMDGNEAHIELLKEAYAWHETLRRKEMEPWQLEAWETMSKAYTDPEWGRTYYRPGWPDGVLPDGSNWGRCLQYHIIPWYPVTPEMKTKYGGLIQDVRHCNLKVWADGARAGNPLPGGLRWGGLNHNSRGNAMVQIRRALLEHKRGGYQSLLKYYTNPTKYTPDQYLQARVDAARRALDARNVRLAAMRDVGMKSLEAGSAAGLIAQKGRWYGPKGTKWGAAYDDRVLHLKLPLGTAWYQWQLVYDAMLARGEISAAAAARGGRGMECWASSMAHLDSYDVLGHYDMRVSEIENYFDIPALEPAENTRE